MEKKQEETKGLNQDLEHFRHYKVFCKTLKAYKQYASNMPSNPYAKDVDHERYEWKRKYEDCIKDIFKSEYLKYFDKEYFFGCSYEVYAKTYNERFCEYKKTFIDADEVDFLTTELDEGVLKHKFEGFDIDEMTSMQILYSLKKRLLFIEQRLEINGYELGVEEDEAEIMSYSLVRTEKNLEISKGNIKPLKWQGTELQLTELTKALKESNLLNPELSQKVIFDRLKEFMQVEKYNEAEKLKEIRKRTKDKTPLLNILETSLNNWIIKKD